jgi:pilus assembly protein CpaB
MLKILSPGTLGIGLLAILTGLAGAWVVRARLHQGPPPKKEGPKARTVPLAAVDLPAGRTLTMGDVGLYSMTVAEMKEKEFDLNLTMMAPEQIIGRTLKAPVRQGQPFLSTSLFLEGTRPGVMDRLKPGLRAYTLLVSKERLGALGAGARVDVLFRSAATNPTQSSGALPIPELTVTLMRGVEILDVYEPPSPASRGGNSRQNGTLDLEARFNRNATPLPQVTLAVTPEQAVKLQAVQSRGEITLIGWPGEADVEAEGAVRAPEKVSLRDVLSLKPPEKPNDFQTEIYRRTNRTVNMFRNGRLLSGSNGNPSDPPLSDADDSTSPATPPPPAPGLDDNTAQKRKRERSGRIDSTRRPQRAIPQPTAAASGQGIEVPLPIHQ